MAETAQAAVMTQQDTLSEAFTERGAEIIVRIVIHQGAGIDAHASVDLDQHAAEGTHEAGTGLGAVVPGHAVLADLRIFDVAAGRVEIREADQWDVRGQAMLCQ